AAGCRRAVAASAVMPPDAMTTRGSLNQTGTAEEAAMGHHHDGSASVSGNAQQSHSGHDHAGHAEMFRRKFWISLALTIPTVVYSHMAQDLLGYTAPHFSGSSMIAP